MTTHRLPYHVNYFAYNLNGSGFTTMDTDVISVECWLAQEFANDYLLHSIAGVHHPSERLLIDFLVVVTQDRNQS